MGLAEVVERGIGGMAISGTLGTIVSNPGAIKFVLPSIVSGGLNSAFAGGNFLGGAVGGLSYTANIAGNNITSTDGISSAYKYIISPGYNDIENSQNNWGDYLPLTKEIYAQYILGRGRGQLTPNDQIYLGYLFENQFIEWGSKNIHNGFAKNSIKFNNTIPDGVEAYSLTKEVILSPFRVIPALNFYEMKCSFNNIGCGTAQVKKEITGLRRTNVSLGVPDEPYVGNMYIVTPYNVGLTKGLKNFAEQNNIDLIQYKSVYQIRGSSMYMNFILDGRPISTASSNIPVPVYRSGN
ncbi:hypothetical protein CQ046_14430 [Chryseobacterium sp. MYb7]|uniref:hypothetical protein n=1 Tax=Chryseobacterium sp. MYb7 TaxID=1827290 RepID=UPI000D48A947|nr:hypothetical protein [Chryseobacterium sp. MYb7]PRB01892.1 hypothetical protein CQ046_14430 [Chryseobacterium sp. MYb7]